MTTFWSPAGMPSFRAVAVNGAEAKPAGMVILAGTAKRRVSLLDRATDNGEAKSPLRLTNTEKAGCAAFSAMLSTGARNVSTAGTASNEFAASSLLASFSSATSLPLSASTNNRMKPTRKSAGMTTCWVRHSTAPAARLFVYSKPPKISRVDPELVAAMDNRSLQIPLATAGPRFVTAQATFKVCPGKAVFGATICVTARSGKGGSVSASGVFP